MKGMIIVAMVLVVFRCAAASTASFDLNGDGKPDTELISRCGGLIALKQTITHEIKNGLKERITVTWPPAGILDYSAPSMVTSTILTYETYKSCVEGDDKGVEFTISKRKRKFDQGGAAAKPGFITAEIAKVLQEMSVGKIMDIMLAFRSIFDGKPAVTITSLARALPRSFEYTYRVNNQSPDPVVVVSQAISLEVAVPPGEMREVVSVADKPPEEEPTPVRLYTSTNTYHLEITIPVLQSQK